ncbi:solute carrier family 66 member 2 isoform X2 [Tachypleus tridentatus]|uniref:solute carrier family 66 member 2 isoform X2 n=1 Tax=Tachypleus tridentatus TaxID=6853 RepID=UPI003FD37111
MDNNQFSFHHYRMDSVEFSEHLTLSNIVSWCASLAMIFGGVVPYVPQYRDIKRLESAEGFSTYVCLALLIANTLRIIFWFGHPFELPLLIQSVIMILTMLSLIHLCVRVKNKGEIVPTYPKQFTDATEHKQDDQALSHHSEKIILPSYQVFLDFDPRFFWKWTDFLSYVEFLVTFTLVVGAIVYIFIDISLVIEVIGFLALLMEAMLGAPQFLRNFQNKSTFGMSKTMVIMWTMGDIFKTCYFILRNSPIQFWICGILQVSIDIAILLQVVVYRSKQMKHSVHSS